MNLPNTPTIKELLRQYPDAPIIQNQYTVNEHDFAKHERRQNHNGVYGGSIGIVWLPDGKVPLVKRTHSLTGWALPSGGLEPGDSYHKTFVKEMGEELGVRLILDSIQLVLIEQQVWTGPDGRQLSQVLATFAADVLPGDVPHETEETIAEGLTIETFDVDNLPKLIFTDGDKIARAFTLRRL